MIIPGSTIGIIGGGQLGRMTALAAANLGFKSHIYCEEHDSPAGQVASAVTVSAYDDLISLKKFASIVDVVTFEFENIPACAAQVIANIVTMRPSWNVLHVSQNRLREKAMINRLQIATANYRSINNAADLRDAISALGYHGIIKTCELGYDGKGQFVIKNKQDMEDFLVQHEINSGGQWIFEAWIDYACEISIIIARNELGESRAFPAALNKHQNGILDKSVAPAPIDQAIANRAQLIAISIADHLGLVGMLAVEFFVLANGELIVNELAPRPHNSGHWTMDACVTSQFEQLVRVVAGLPFGSTAIYAKAEMTNLIGEQVLHFAEYLEQDDVKLHLYGKSEIKPGRKMGHYNRIFPLNWSF